MSEATFRLEPGVAERLRAVIPAVAERAVAAIVSEVPSYADPFSRGMGATIETAVRVALDGFVDLASSPGSDRQRARLRRVHDAARVLGQGEARAGRSMDALTSAYGVGARASWRDIGTAAIDAGMAATEVALFAELVFTYINELSVSSINGHAEALASSAQIRQRRLERLCRKLLDGAPADELIAAAKLADWEPPDLIAVLLPESEVNDVVLAPDARLLQPGEDLPGLPAERAVLLVGGQSGRDRSALLRALGSTAAIVGPARAWMDVRQSYERAVQSHRLTVTPSDGPLDTDTYLLELVLGADPDALADLRTRVLEPLRTVAPAAREKLAATLREWLLHQGRRDDVAAALFVHPQTVRYRMGQLRDLYGDRLTDPRFALELTVALATGS